MANSKPQRMCIGCRNSFDKKALLRIVKTKEGEVVVDSTGKKNGRGAYICNDTLCLKKAKKSGTLNSALKTKIDGEIYDEIERQIEDEANK